MADRERCRRFAESSASIVTPLNRYIGYEAAAKVAKESLARQLTIREVVLEHGYVEQGKLTVQQLDEALDVLAMTGPGTGLAAIRYHPGAFRTGAGGTPEPWALPECRTRTGRPQRDHYRLRQHGRVDLQCTVYVPAFWKV